jgi:hypothetical protein
MSLFRIRQARHGAGHADHACRRLARSSGYSADRFARAHGGLTRQVCAGRQMQPGWLGGRVMRPNICGGVVCVGSVMRVGVL